jgi:hypothetical protein
MKSEQFRENAEQCLRRADEAQQDSHRALYQNMEVCWRALVVTASLAEDGVGFSTLRDGAQSE